MVSTIMQRLRPSQTHGPKRRASHAFASRMKRARPAKHNRRRQYSPFFFVALIVTLVSTIGFAVILSAAMMAS